MYRNHGPAVEVKGQLVTRMSVAAEKFHLLLDPLHGSRRPNDNIEVLNGGVGKFGSVRKSLKHFDSSYTRLGFHSQEGSQGMELLFP